MDLHIIKIILIYIIYIIRKYQNGKEALGGRLGVILNVSDCLLQSRQNLQQEKVIEGC